VTRTGHHEINTYNSAGGWPGLDAPKTTLRVPQVPCSWGPWEAPDLNWQKEAHGLAGSVPANADVARRILASCKIADPLSERAMNSKCLVNPRLFSDVG